jgi:hypothetical protein
MISKYVAKQSHDFEMLPTGDPLWPGCFLHRSYSKAKIFSNLQNPFQDCRACIRSSKSSRLLPEQCLVIDVNNPGTAFCDLGFQKQLLPIVIGDQCIMNLILAVRFLVEFARLRACILEDILG